MTVEDPFAHVHDEDYAAAFSRDWVGASSFVDPGGRAVQSLDGDWEMTLDPFDEGLRQRWYALDDAPPESWRVPRDYDPGGADIVPVPSCWNLLRPELKYYEGAVWYVRSFDATPAPGMRQLLQFGAANYAARVFLNGRFLGAHRGGSTPFTLDATQALVAGKNRLMVHVENRRRDDRVPMSHFDWFNYGGLHRGVGLLQVPALHVKSFAMHLVADSDKAIEVRVELSAQVDAAAHVFVSELGLEAPLEIAGGVGTARIAAKPELWSPERPRLYDIEIVCGSDRVRERVGFRRIATRGTDILLNGSPLRLKGACVHEDDVVRGR
ncbi:MAG: sugar-binding domain-containing protein [Rhodospirillales bacterium]